MTLTLPLAPLTSLLTEHPWSAIVLVFVLSVVLPAVWCPRHREAALTVLTVVLLTVTAIAAALRDENRHHRS